MKLKQHSYAVHHTNYLCILCRLIIQGAEQISIMFSEYVNLKPDCLNATTLSRWWGMVCGMPQALAIDLCRVAAGMQFGPA
jgi:hypothetical protein